MRLSVIKHVLSLPNLSIEDEGKNISIEPGIRNKCPYVPSPESQSVETPSLSVDYLLKDTFSEKREITLMQFGNKFHENNDNRWNAETTPHYAKQNQLPMGAGTKKKYRSCNHDPRKHDNNIVAEIEQNSGDILSNVHVRDPLTLSMIGRRKAIKDISPFTKEQHKGIIFIMVFYFHVL